MVLGVLLVDFVSVLLGIRFIVYLCLIFLDSLQLLVVLRCVHLHVWLVCIILLQNSWLLELALLLHIHFVNIRSSRHQLIQIHVLEFILGLILVFQMLSLALLIASGP